MIGDDSGLGLNFKAKLRAVSDLIKPELPLAAGICVVAGEILALKRFPSASHAVLGFLVGFFISGSAMISNDYFDLNVDRINHPERPLPSERITVLELTVLTCFFSVAGLLIAAVIGALPLALALVFLAIGLFYNWKFKETGLPGNMLVSGSVGITFVFGGVAVGGLASGIVWVFAILAFMFDLAEEIAGGAMDMKGDELRSSKSLAILKGQTFALRTSAVLLAACAGLSFLPFVLG
jgi:geranylgeranylglycerol-phosphate geranylgeranyltransferase